MGVFQGAAALCKNGDGELLMVLQGRPDVKEAELKWSVPSGGKFEEETFEQCCIREVKEETGYDVRIVRNVYEKKGDSNGYNIHIVYYEVEVIGGQKEICDPDGLIHKIDWKRIEEIEGIGLSFPEDKKLLQQFYNRSVSERL
ncbi:NUDIX hydrolase [Bacillus sp. DX1.1]|uniref:NUDIX hydrolase n=1 Tax=unclassified Bacillus (in: firmicutes) TaxID=185979 RepID=UPI0025701F9C|nr:MULTISPECIES: NUDIX hydrolase [unclassified Bacillus (in: firmicutes)]MDM5154254.1 NUDIX hydrolase [Bacillus sp. DX1.1]WJE83173.1 NUDIX hydrolase [Bacillus sp. DX3.1]